MNTIALRVAWDGSPDADRYAVYVRPVGGHFSEYETKETSIVLQIPEGQPTDIYVSSRQGALENISSEEIHVYVTRW